MRTALGTSLVFTLALVVALTMALAPLPASAAVPAGSFALQQPDNSQNAPQYPSQDNSQQQPQDNSQQSNPPPQDNSQGSSGYQAFSADQLDNLLSPIALYPDPLLAQVFVAATFPDQVEEAARFVRAGGTMMWTIRVGTSACAPSPTTPPSLK